ncbi:MAG: hypothetical protein ACRCWG_06620 [Sarcina sp.]
MGIQDILDLLKKNLTIPVKFGWFDSNIKGTHLTFTLLSENPNLFDDNEFELEESLYQFDLWSEQENPDKYTSIIKKLLIQNGFKYITTQGFYEKEDNIFHIAFRFSIENSENYY